MKIYEFLVYLVVFIIAVGFYVKLGMCEFITYLVGCVCTGIAYVMHLMD